MYWRYFMWNFAGRQNDVQGNGNSIHGNWISGINLIDEARLGNLELYPPDLQTNKDIFFLASYYWSWWAFVAMEKR
jgi:hypothetical protein